MSKYVIEVKFELVVSGGEELNVKLRNMAVNPVEAGLPGGDAVSKSYAATVATPRGSYNRLEVPLNIVVIESPGGHGEESEAGRES